MLRGSLFKPKLCCLLKSEVVCHCGYALCSRHLVFMPEHLTPVPGINYYYHCQTDLAVVWHDMFSEPIRYRFAYYEAKYEDSQAEEKECEKVMGPTQPCDKGRRKRNQVSSAKRKERGA